MNLQPGAYDAPALPVELSQHGRGDNRLRDRHGNFATAWFCQLNAFMAVALGLVLPAGIEPARYVLTSYIKTGGMICCEKDAHTAAMRQQILIKKKEYGKEKYEGCNHQNTG